MYLILSVFFSNFQRNFLIKKQLGDMIHYDMILGQSNYEFDSKVSPKSHYLNLCILVSFVSH